ncbi:MAG: alpha/beta hydrolase [Proteobacteria bacterium]|nr:MAG: alpha/beta hydrolase [Pseudomonadota bacterium]
MTVQQRNHVRVRGDGERTMVFAHGFGCDQNMWHKLAPAYESRYRVVLFDHVGGGSSDLTAYDPVKYGTLDGYAEDVLQIVKELGRGQAIFVGHSVSAMIGMLANLREPELFAAQIMIGPSPCYINDGDYVGGFTQADIDDLLDTLDGNYLGWSANIAPVIMGAPDQPELAVELTNSFCRTDPEIAKRFARVTFLTDVCAEAAQLRAPTLILQSDEDLIAPVTVGQYLHGVIPNSTLTMIENVGHCPHLSAPDATRAGIDAFLAARGL